MRVAGLILAAGSASRFGASKALAHIDGRPLLEHSLGAARAAGLDPIHVVLGVAADSIEAEIAWTAERRLRNPDPGRGLSSSLAIGVEAIGAEDPPIDAAIVVLGDQPRTDPDVIRRLISRFAEDPGSGAAFVVPRYSGEAARTRCSSPDRPSDWSARRGVIEGSGRSSRRIRSSSSWYRSRA